MIWFASYSLLEGGCNVPHPALSTPQGISTSQGGLGELACSGGAMLRRNFELSEPAGKPVMIEPSWKEARE